MMATKYYTITLTEKQKFMVLDALGCHSPNIQDDPRSGRVLDTAYEKIMNAKSGARKEKTDGR